MRVGAAISGPLSRHARECADESSMVLRIDLPEGPLLADVGFGGLAQPQSSNMGLSSDRRRRTNREVFADHITLQ
jgi:hypothetical protein